MQILLYVLVRHVGIKHSTKRRVKILIPWYYDIKSHQNEFMLEVTKISIKMLVFTVSGTLKAMISIDSCNGNPWGKIPPFENTSWFSFWESEGILWSHCNYFEEKKLNWMVVSYSIKSSTCSKYLFAISLKISKPCFADKCHQ